MAITRCRTLAFLCLFALSLFSLPKHTQAATVTWTGATNSTWVNNSAANWSALYTNNVDDVVFNDTGANTAITVSGTVSPLSMLFNNSSLNYSLNSAAVSGTTGLTKSGTGTLTLNVNNTFSGKTILNGGTLSIAADLRLGTAPGAPVADQLTFNGGKLSVTAGTTLATNRGWTINGAGGTLDAQAAVSFAGSIVGSGTLIKQGTGILTLSGNNSAWTGALQIDQGRVDLTSTATQLGTASPGVTMANGTMLSFTAGGNFTWADDITSNGGQLFNNISSNTNLSGTINAASNTTTISNFSGSGGTFSILGDLTGNGNVKFTSAGNFQTVTLSGAKTYTGNTTVEGLLNVSSNSNLSTGTLTFNNPLVGGTARNFILNLSNAAQTVGTFSGTITDPGSGHNTTLALATNHTLTINQTANGTYQGTISGSGAKIIMGAASTSQLVFANANTYTGGTTINGGTLLVNNTTGSGTGTGAVTVNSTGGLGGTGTITTAGLVDIKSGGTLSPGNNGIGTLTLNGSGGLNLRPGSVLSVEVQDTGVGEHDLLSVSGTATLGGSLDVSFLGGGTLNYSDSVVILSAGTLVGTFSNAPTEGSKLSFDGIQFSVSYLNNMVTLTQFHVPEPGSMLLLTGILGCAVLRRRGRRTAASY